MNRFSMFGGAAVVCTLNSVAHVAPITDINDILTANYYNNLDFVCTAKTKNEREEIIEYITKSVTRMLTQQISDNIYIKKKNNYKLNVMNASYVTFFTGNPNNSTDDTETEITDYNNAILSFYCVDLPGFDSAFSTKYSTTPFKVISPTGLLFFNLYTAEYNENVQPFQKKASVFKLLSQYMHATVGDRAILYEIDKLHRFVGNSKQMRIYNLVPSTVLFKIMGALNVPFTTGHTTWTTDQFKKMYDVNIMENSTGNYQQLSFRSLDNCMFANINRALYTFGLGGCAKSGGDALRTFISSITETADLDSKIFLTDRGIPLIRQIEQIVAAILMLNDDIVSLLQLCVININMQFQFGGMTFSILPATNQPYHSATRFMHIIEYNDTHDTQFEVPLLSQDTRINYNITSTANDISLPVSLGASPTDIAFMIRPVIRFKTPTVGGIKRAHDRLTPETTPMQPTKRRIMQTRSDLTNPAATTNKITIKNTKKTKKNPEFKITKQRRHDTIRKFRNKSTALPDSSENYPITIVRGIPICSFEYLIKDLHTNITAPVQQMQRKLVGKHDKDVTRYELAVQTYEQLYVPKNAAYMNQIDDTARALCVLPSVPFQTMYTSFIHKCFSNLNMFINTVTGTTKTKLYHDPAKLLTDMIRESDFDLFTNEFNTLFKLKFRTSYKQLISNVDGMINKSGTKAKLNYTENRHLEGNNKNDTNHDEQVVYGGNMPVQKIDTKTI